MRFDPLDIFKLIPVGATALAFDGIGKLLNPIMYTQEQHYAYLATGAIAGGLWSIFLLGGFAKAGNKKSLLRWSIPLALMWSLDAEIVRGEVLTVAVNPHYKELKKEYISIPHKKDLSEIKLKLAGINAKIVKEKNKLDIDFREKREEAEQKAKSEYLANYRKYGWWKNKAREVGCSVSVGLDDNMLERKRRIDCIIDASLGSLYSKKLERLMATKKALELKQKAISNVNTDTSVREMELKNKIDNIESKTFQMWVYYGVMFFVGWFIESMLPHLKHWREWENEKAELRNETVGSLSRENDERRKQMMLQRVDEILATKQDMLEFLKLHIDDAKMNQKYNTFFSVLRAIRAGETDLKISTIQKYSTFINPKEHKPYNVKRYAVQVREEFKKYNYLDTANLVKIIKKL